MLGVRHQQRALHGDHRARRGASKVRRCVLPLRRSHAAHRYLQNASIFFWFVVLFENTVRLQTNRPFVDYEKEVKRFRDMHNGSNNPMRTQTSVWTSDPIIEKGPWTPPTMPLK